MAEKARLTIRIDPEKREALSRKARKEGKNSTEVVMAFIDSYLGIDGEESFESRLSRLEKVVEEKLEQSLGELVA